MKKALALILALAAVFSLTACGQAAKSADTAYYYSASDDGWYPEADFAAGEVFYSAEYAAQDIGIANAYSREAAAPEAVPQEESNAPSENPDKIIYSADATVETTKFEDTLAQLDELIKKYGGWVESSSVSGANYYSISRGNKNSRSASYTIRIPSGDFNSVMSGLTALGNVPYSHIYTENVTAQYYDTQARIDSYKTQEQSLLRLMDKAESVEDIITIESKLAEVRYSIESLQSTINNWDRRVSYSTVYLTVDEVSEYTPEAVVTVSFGEKLVKAVKDGFRSAGEFLSGLVLWLVEALPTLVIIAVIGFGIFMAVRPAIRKRRARKEEKKARKENEKNV